MVKWGESSRLIYLWLVAILPLVWIWVASKRNKQAKQMIHPSLWSRVIPQWSQGARGRKFFFTLLVLLLGLIAFARPQWGEHEETVKVSGMDIFFVLDVSNSMETEDIVPSRLKKAQHLMRSIIERLKGDRVGVVLFAGSAYLASPLTTDHDYVIQMLPTFTTKSITAQGTDIGSALELASKAIERGAADPSQADQNSKAVILISDGEDLEDGAMEGAKILKSVGARFFAMGIGTEKGGPIPMRDDAGVLLGYKKTKAGAPVVSSFKPDALIKLSKALDGKFYSVTNDEREIDELMQELGSISRGEYQERRMVTYIERFQIPLALAVFLMIIELWIPARRMLVVLFLVHPLTAMNAQAEPPSAGVYFENEKGLAFYKEGKIDEAQKSFDQAQAKDPTRPELDFNQGTVLLEKGETDKADEFFKRAEENAKGNKLGSLSSEIEYNRGALAQTKKNYVDAVEHFSKAIDLARESKNKALEDMARKKIESMTEQKKQDQQKQEQDKKDQEKKDQQEKQDQKNDKKDGKGKDQEKDKKDDKGEKDDKKEEQKKQYSREKQGFKSEKLSKEDAERVMAELLGKEKDLQKKLGKKRGKNEANEKDW